MVRRISIYHQNYRLATRKITNHSHQCRIQNLFNITYMKSCHRLYIRKYQYFSKRKKREDLRRMRREHWGRAACLLISPCDLTKNGAANRQPRSSLIGEGRPCGAPISSKEEAQAVGADSVDQDRPNA